MTGEQGGGHERHARRERREAVKGAEEARRDESRRVAERVARDAEPTSQGPIGPADVVGGPIPDARTGGTHVDSDAAGVPGAPAARGGEGEEGGTGSSRR